MTEEDALGVFGLVSRSALEGLAGAILKGDVGAILSSIEAFDSAGKNMRRLTGELLRHFRNLVVVQALGPNAKSLEATPDQIKVLAAQAQAVDPGRLFRICDQLADAEDKLDDSDCRGTDESSTRAKGHGQALRRGRSCARRTCCCACRVRASCRACEAAARGAPCAASRRACGFGSRRAAATAAASRKACFSK